MLSIDLTGKRAFVAGVADESGYGFAICKALAEAGASIVVATHAPAYRAFTTALERGELDEALTLSDGRKLTFEKIYPFDAAYDVDADLPADVRALEAYRDLGDVSIDGVCTRLQNDFGATCLDVVVHSLANAPEQESSLLETSRRGYLAAIGVSAFSYASMVQRLGPMVNGGGSFVSLSYIASERVMPGFGGGLSSAKAALESDARVLAYEAGKKWRHRVNVISAGPWPTRASSAAGTVQMMADYCKANSPLPESLTAREVGATVAFLSSPLASGITGTTIFVDKGHHVMGTARRGVDFFRMQAARAEHQSQKQ